MRSGCETKIQSMASKVRQDEAGGNHDSRHKLAQWSIRRADCGDPQCIVGFLGDIFRNGSEAHC